VCFGLGLGLGLVSLGLDLGIMGSGLGLGLGLVGSGLGLGLGLVGSGLVNNIENNYKLFINTSLFLSTFCQDLVIVVWTLKSWVQILLEPRGFNFRQLRLNLEAPIPVFLEKRKGC